MGRTTNRGSSGIVLRFKDSLGNMTGPLLPVERDGLGYPLLLATLQEPDVRASLAEMEPGWTMEMVDLDA